MVEKKAGPLSDCERLAGGVKRALLRAIYPFLSSRVKLRAEDYLFHPQLNRSIFRRLALAGLNHNYSHLSEEKQRTLAERLWAGRAGLNWIHDKRDRYRRGDMERFIKNVRHPFESMVIDYLTKAPGIRIVLEIGTGTGQLLFDLLSKTNGDRLFIGIDLNSEATAANQEKAADFGVAERLRFYCSDATKWLQCRQGSEPVLGLSVATLKYFTPAQLVEFLTVFRRQCGGGALAICEDVLPDFRRGSQSAYTGGLGWSHNYPGVLRRLSYELQYEEIRSTGERHLETSFFYAIAVSRD